MAVQHANLPNSELHEPKDVSGASADQLYHADGGGSGDWEYQEHTVNVSISDISTAQSVWVAVPYACTVEKIYSVIDGAIATADTTLTSKIGGVDITNGAITVSFSGSAAGDVDSATPSAANAVSSGGSIEIATDGASTNTVVATITLVLKRTS